MEFDPRGWNGDASGVTIDIKDEYGNVQIQVKGNFNQTLEATNLQTGETWVVFQSPENIYPSNHKMQFGFNNFTLQLNQISQNL